MDLSRKEYPALLDTLQPSQAVLVLQERVKRVNRLNTEIADWLQERRKVEETYVAGLKRLVKKQPPDESSDLGIFSVPWEKIVSSAETIALSHHTLAQKIENDVELPLRDFASKNREMQAMSTIQGNLASMAKEVDGATDKVDKLKKKGGKAAAEKVASAASNVESANSQWASQAPFVFEKLQAVDETRLNHLRDVLTQFQTHEVDQIERNRVSAEQTLNLLLNVETVDEIKTFAAKQTGAQPPKLHRQRSRTFQPANLTPVTPVASTDDAASQISGTSGGASKTATSTQESRHGGIGGGLKRLGTVIRGRRQSAVPYGRTPSPGKQSTDRFSAFGRNSKEAPPVPLPRNANGNGPSSPIREDSQPSQPRVPGASPSHLRNLPNGERSGTSSDRPGGGSELEGSSFSELGALPPIQSAPPITVTGEERRDAEGFQVPPPAVDAITKAEQEASLGENQNPQFKLDIRNHPIQEEDADAESALANVANTLRAQAAPNRKLGTSRGRREVRNTVFVPSPQSPEITGSESPNALNLQKPNRTMTLASEDHMGSDTQSIRSSHSLSTIGSAVIRHPELHEPGLNSSVVETVSAWFEHGQITKAVVIGELALAYNAPNFPSASTTENIRLENFTALEKVAPNPTFVTQIVDRSGEYTLGLNNIHRTAVAFKYQLHLEDSNFASHVPLILTPSWKVEPKQTSVILSYSFNSAFGKTVAKQIKLRDVTVVIHLEGTKALSCQSKPVGTFSKEKSLIYWRLSEIDFAPDAPPSKLLARFATETEAKPGNVEARWEILGDHAVGLGSGLGVGLMTTLSSAAPGGGSVDADPFADERAVPSPSVGWKEIPTVRRLVSGKYSAV